MIVIVDYGMGNCGSIANMLKHVGAEVEISSEASNIKKAKKLILPGVGAFDRAMKNLEDLNLIPLLEEQVLQKKIPLLGICLGMQLLAEQSEEGQKRGFNWIKGNVKKFRFDSAAGNKDLKIPHMGWNFVKPKKQSPLFCELEGDARFYFVHSYCFFCENTEDQLACTSYGHEFTSIVQKENITGVQFHPEKSHKYGMRLLENFVRYC